MFSIVIIQDILADGGVCLALEVKAFMTQYKATISILSSSSILKIRGRPKKNTTPRVLKIQIIEMFVVFNSQLKSQPQNTMILTCFMNILL